MLKPSGPVAFKSSAAPATGTPGPAGAGQIKPADDTLQRLQARVADLEAVLGNLIRPDGTVQISSNRRIEISVGGNTLLIEGNGITLRGVGRLELACANKVVVNSSVVDVSAGQVKFNAGLVQATGVVKAQTVQATNVIGASYTPGAGNIF